MPIPAGNARYSAITSQLFFATACECIETIAGRVLIPLQCHYLILNHCHSSAMCLPALLNHLWGTVRQARRL
ncbi:hypothetical protein BDV26DRAFT_251334, partial [Aspergillus bertholletiae]